jgi:CubicO group peptidase (beta-lactamase class C family)
MKRPTLKRIALILAGLALLAIAAVGIFVASEWTYISRMRSHPANSILDVAWYEPKEAVPGARHPVPLPVADGIAPDAFAEAVKLAESKNASALLVVYKGRVVLDRHWHGHRPGDQTNSASMAKTVTALLIGIAVGEGKIASIDEPAAKWIPAWRDDARKRITLRHLLQMHAGLKPMGEYEEPYSDASYLALGTDSRYVVDNVPAVEEPGPRYDYNNVNFQVLGVVLEAATGRRYAFKQNGILVHFAAFTNHIGLYPPIHGDVGLEKAIAPYAGEKGNLRFPLDRPIPYDLIERIVKHQVKKNLAKAPKRKKGPA